MDADETPSAPKQRAPPTNAAADVETGVELGTVTPI